MSDIYVKCIYCEHRVYIHGTSRCSQNKDARFSLHERHVCPDFQRNDEEIGCENTDSPVCPYCGIEYNVWDDDDLDDDGELGEYTCGNCEKVYYIRVEVTYVFTSRKEEDKEK